MRYLILLLLIAGCPSPVSPTPNPPNADYCAAAQTKWLELKCIDSRGKLIGGPNLHGISYADTCKEDLKNGVDLHSKCISESNSCEEGFACK